MADYTQSIDFSAKDILASGDSGKVAKGVDIDTELALISTAIASKIDESREAQASGIATLDSNTLIPVAQLPAATTTAVGVLEIATDAEATTGTATDKWLTPANLQAVLDQNAGMAEDLTTLVDPNADRILFWDDGAGSVALLTVSTGLTLSGTNLTSDDANIDHDALSNFVANEHLDWTSDLGATNIDVGNIIEGAVTQHEAALTILQTQIDTTTVSQAEAEAGTATTDRLWTAERVKQAIAALETSVVGRSGCKVFDASAQTIANTTETAINFDSEAYDTNDFHDNSTNNTRITIPSGVTWVVLSAQVMWTANSSAERFVRIRKDGSSGAVDDAMGTYQPLFEMTANVGANNWHQYVTTGIINVAATDYFEVTVRQASGGNLNVIASQSWFQCEVIE